MPDSSSKVIENSDLTKGLVVADKNNNEWVWIVVPKSVTKEATTDAEIETTLQTYAIDYRGTWTDEWYAMDGETLVYASKEGLTEAQKELNNGCGLTYSEYNTVKSKMLQSIKANGGFWISRYEAGIEGSVQNPSVARIEEGELTTSSLKAVSKLDHIPYNYVTCSQAQSLASKMTPNTTKASSLLFGIQWDLVCKYLEGKDGLITADINEDSASWGNYYDNSLNITSAKAMGAEWNTSTYKLGEWQNVTEKLEKSETLLTTGASTEIKKMNIYDFTGNEWEAILEKVPRINKPCSVRGGVYLGGGNYPAYRCLYHSTSQNSHVGSFRTTLY